MLGDGIFDGVFDNAFGPDPKPEEATPNQARRIIARNLLAMSHAMKNYGELLEKNAPKPRPGL